MGKILIHSLIFSPDGVSTAYLYSDIAKRLKNEGFDVMVLTTTPHYNIVPEQVEKQPLTKHLLGLYYTSDFDGIKVYHITQKKFKSTILRLFCFVYWHIISTIIALSIKNIDLILSPSPPLTIGVLNVLISKIKHCKTIYNVQEIYPDLLHLKEGLLLSLLRSLELYVYNNSSAVTTIDEVFYNQIADRFKDKSKLRIIPNFVDTDLCRYTEFDDLNSVLFPKNDSIKLMYAGNIGIAQDWKPLISLAEKLKDADIEFFVIGEGAKKGYVESEKNRLKLDKLHVLPYQKRELMPKLISYADLQFIFMEPTMEKDGFPSKIYTIMSCSKPVLVCSGTDTSITKFLSPIGCGKLVTETDYEKKIEIMADWLRNITKKDLIELGVKGRDVVDKFYTKEIVTKQYSILITSLLQAH